MGSRLCNSVVALSTTRFQQSRCTLVPAEPLWLLTVHATPFGSHPLPNFLVDSACVPLCCSAIPRREPDSPSPLRGNRMHRPRFRRQPPPRSVGQQWPGYVLPCPSHHRCVHTTCPRSRVRLRSTISTPPREITLGKAPRPRESWQKSRPVYCG